MKYFFVIESDNKNDLRAIYVMLKALEAKSAEVKKDDKKLISSLRIGVIATRE